MSKVKMYALLFMIVLIVTVSTTIVSAEEIKKISFKASANGPFFIIYGEGENAIDSPVPIPYIHAGAAHGKASIRGRAQNTFPYTSFLGEGYTSEYVNALGAVSVSWIENEGAEGEEKHWLVGWLYSSSKTEGFFKPDSVHEQQILTIPEPGVGGEDEALEFRGMHISISGFKIINGFAVWNTLPGKILFPYCPNCDYFINNAYLNWLAIADQDFILYNLIWSELEVPHGVCPFGTIPPTESIQWNVEVVS